MHSFVEMKVLNDFSVLASLRAFVFVPVVFCLLFDHIWTKSYVIVRSSFNFIFKMWNYWFEKSSPTVPCFQGCPLTAPPIYSAVSITGNIHMRIFLVDSIHKICKYRMPTTSRTRNTFFWIRSFFYCSSKFFTGSFRSTLTLLLRLDCFIIWVLIQWRIIVMKVLIAGRTLSFCCLYLSDNFFSCFIIIRSIWCIVQMLLGISFFRIWRLRCRPGISLNGRWLRSAVGVIMSGFIHGFPLASK